MSRKSTRKGRKVLCEMQEGLCGLCWLPLQENLSTDHILPKSWYDKLGKTDKNRMDNLQAAHADCNSEKDSYPSPWHRHTLRMCLATIRGEELDTDSVLWKLAGAKPATQNTPILQGPEWVHLSGAFGLIVPYIHKYFNDQGLRVPPRIRSDQFSRQFIEWMNTEPMRTRYDNERAKMYAEAPEMWSRAVEHEFRLSLPGYVRGELTMRPGFKVPADAEGPPVGIRKQMDDETVFEGFIWPTEDPLTFAISKLREDKPVNAVDAWH